MNILVLSDHFPPDTSGGAAQIALIQCRALQRLGHDVQVLSVRTDRTATTDVEVEGVPVHRLHIRYPLRWRAYLSLNNPVAVRAVRGFLAARSFDIVHAHNIHTYLTYHSLRLARRRGLPVVLTAHDVMTAAYQKFDSYIDPDWRDCPEAVDYRVTPWSQIKLQRFRYFPLRNAIIRRYVGRYVDAVVSPSDELIKFLHVNHVVAGRMVTIHNGIDSSRFTARTNQMAAFRRAQNLKGRQLILFAGRVNGPKGGAQILAALPRIVERVPQAGLLILAPPGGYGEWMLDRAAEMGVREHIHFAGWLGGDDLAAAYSAADVCAIPSVCFDNFPTVALEAGAAGLPVVATCFGGAKEIVMDGETGYILNPYNTDLLAERIVRLLSDERLRRRMGEAARQRVRQHFDWLNQAARLVELYREVLDRSG